VRFTWAVLPCSARFQPDLLSLLGRLMTDATAPELDLCNYQLSTPASISSADRGAAGRSGSGADMAMDSLDGGQVVAAGWHAARVAARLCGASQALQDAAVERGWLPALAQFVQAEPPAFEEDRGTPELAAATSGGGGAADFVMAIRCEVAGLLRSLSLRRQHHAALRACPGLVASLAALLRPGAAGWAELKAAARRILQASAPCAVAHAVAGLEYGCARTSGRQGHILHGGHCAAALPSRH
jgi:hypothetical protein